MKTSQSIVAVFVFLAWSLSAQETSKTETWKDILRTTPAPELPFLTAKWIKEANASQRKSLTVAVVEAAVAINPAAAALIVGTISREVPEMAPLAAATAAAKQPAQAEPICLAATGVAPAMAAHILEAVCDALPQQCATLAIAAAQVTPKAEKEILRSPALRARLAQQIQNYQRDAPSVALILEHARRAQTNAATATPGQITRPVRLSSEPAGKPDEGHSNNGGNGWHGGRNYARP
jgi:hypothetical protein